MPVPFLYAAVVAIWGTTWFAIAFQLGPVAIELSVAYRFAIAAVLLFAFARLSGRSVAVPLPHYPMVVLMGALMFCATYLCVYYGSAYVTTGLVAVLFSLIVVANGLCERIFFGTPFDARLGAAAILGLGGMGLVFWPEIASFDLRDRAITGVLWVVASVGSAALGNMAAIVNTRRGLPVTTVNAHGMVWGAALAAGVALLLDRPLRFSTEPGYVWSLAFLAIFGSSVVFGCYLVLLKRIGSARAAYTSVLYPVVALAVSTLFEGYRWTPPALAGVLLIGAGNWLALGRPGRMQPALNQQSNKQREERWKKSR